MAKKILAICAAVVAFAVVPAVASASPELVYNEGGATVGVGEEVTGFGSLEFASGLSTVRCNESHMTGTVATNTGTHVSGNITSASFKNSGGHCTTNIFGVSVEPTAEALPWCLTSSVLGTWSLRGGGCGEKARSLAFTQDVYVGTGLVGTCTYEKAEVTGTYNTSSSPLVATVGKSMTFTRTSVTGEGANYCGETGTLTGSLTLTSKGKALKMV
jgi:hypothetical protein